nr:MAG TPA: hypothetical protein [Caudoviricetes sp.]
MRMLVGVTERRSGISRKRKTGCVRMYLCSI